MESPIYVSVETLAGEPTTRSLPETIIRPFITDTQWLDDYFPELADVKNAYATYDLIEDTVHENAEELLSDVSRATRRRAYSNVSDESADSVNIASLVLASDPEASTEQESVIQFLKDNYGFIGSGGQIMAEQLAVPVAMQADFTRTLLEKQPSFGQRLHALMAAHETSAYGLLKTLLSASEKLEDVQNAEFFAFMIHAQPGVYDRPSWTQLLKEQLETGSFDQHIAYDMLAYAVNQTDEAERTPAQEKIRNLWRLISACSDEKDQNALMNRMVTHMDKWPADAISAVHGSRVQLSTYLNSQQRAVQVIKEGLSLHVIPEQREAVFKERIEDYRVAYFKTSPLVVSKAQVMQMRAQRKRRHSRKENNNAAMEAESGATAEEARPLRELHVLGISAVDSESAINALKQDYLKGHLGAPGLTEDLDAILQRMREFDFSTGRIPGVTKYSGTYNKNGERHNVWGFKPMDAVGLSTSSRFAKKIRVLFSINDTETIDIIRIVDRDDILVTKNNVGLRGATRGNK